jgi:hypothetical protein
MVYFETRNPNLGNFWSALDLKMLAYFIPSGIFYGHLGYCIHGHLVHLMFIWYIFSGFGIMYQDKSGNPGVHAVKTRPFITRFPSLGSFVQDGVLRH